MPRIVHVAAPSRLHFGLWSMGGEGRQFGGVGAMIERPGLKLQIDSAAAFAVSGPLAGRALRFARCWAEFHRLPMPDCQIRISAAPPEHVGLGTGTQLGLAVAAGLNAWCALPAQSPLELALSAGRGLRSAVGTYGFALGGLIVEQGKLPGELLSPLDCRVALPAEWRFVLVRPLGLAGLAGDEEVEAMARQAAVPPAIRDEMIAEVRERLVPAAVTADFSAFADSLYRYGNLAGQCFSSRQGGPYNGPVLTALVERIRSFGFCGVGQSSWGPTLFVVTPSDSVAEHLADQMKSISATAEFDSLDLMVADPCNDGARIDVRDE
jgi:beta-RFAP synthase